ncbi:hypothetical protein P175DRAFT_0527612 [Aspergillus ochraceoroseus IBT 24754]|uniref:Uncharacterized protein n=1 Tax=Aspergillus ochraceoroseus IBT 24754 TaxID=1392256 RepID=A0A2T5M6J1_9EURO|nr:uncharacterized protein P175DRAFT_0527612 [Aspergillus ochraceoroseus IBT 24754]PTU24158.1 hypothetical protein P175DRAFT_0527612 [Aspergillus ochraceoroseus IBT 24754]
MAYINGIRSFAHLSTYHWGIALSYAEDALWLLRKADNHAEKYEWREAEAMANDGVEVLQKSVSELPSKTPVHGELTDGCDWPVCLEESLIREIASGWDIALR